MLQDLAHDHQIVRRIAQVIHVRLASFHQADVCGLRPLQDIGLESKIEPDTLRFRRDGLTQLKQTCSVPAADVDDRAEPADVDIRADAFDVATDLSLINEAMKIEWGIRIYGVI